MTEFLNQHIDAIMHTLGAALADAQAVIAPALATANAHMNALANAYGVSHATLIMSTAFACALIAFIVTRLFAERVIAFTVPVPEEARPSWKPREILASPGIHDPAQPSHLQCYDPATGALLGHVPKHTVADVKEMVERARCAQKRYVESTTFADRRRMLRALSGFVVEHQRDISQVCSRDSGKTFVDAFFGEILTTLEKIAWTVRYGEEVLATEYRATGALTMHKVARVDYVPLGVVAAIVSWNYPFHNTFGPMISSLFAGNAILIKSSEHVAWSTTRYFEPLIRRCLEAHGMPADMVQFVIGEGDVGAALVNAGVDRVTFIGSPGVGKKVMEAASRTLTPVVLELGGKDAAILCEDADLAQVVPIVMRGTFQNVGQNCVGLERIVVHQKIHAKFLAQILPLVQRLRQGPTLNPSAPVDCGAMTMPRQLDHIQALVDDAVAKGARLLCGGYALSHKGAPQGQFFEPTVLDGATPSMRIAQEEVFGPILVVMVCKDDAEAVSIVNSSPYGLGGSVFSSNVTRAERIAAQLQTGMININDFGVNYLCQSLPFGGVKASGFGRFAGIEGLRGECVPRAVTTDRFSFIKTSIPPVLDYPLTEKSAAFCEQLAMLVYGRGLMARAKAAWGLALGAVGF